MLLSSNPNLHVPGSRTVVPPQPYIAFSKGRVVLRMHDLLHSAKARGEADLCEEEEQAVRSLSFSSLAQAFDLSSRLGVSSTSTSSLAAIYEKSVNSFLNSIEKDGQVCCSIVS